MGPMHMETFWTICKEKNCTGVGESTDRSQVAKTTYQGHTEEQRDDRAQCEADVVAVELNLLEQDVDTVADEDCAQNLPQYKLSQIEEYDLQILRPAARPL